MYLLQNRERTDEVENLKKRILPTEGSFRINSQNVSQGPQKKREVFLADRARKQVIW